MTGGLIKQWDSEDKKKQEKWDKIRKHNDNSTVEPKPRQKIKPKQKSHDKFNNTRIKEKHSP